MAKKNDNWGCCATGSIKMAKPQPAAKEVTFSLSAPQAREVMLAGDFNNWDYKNTPLKKDKSSLWKKELSLKPGKYEYKFVVDGNWISDPSNNNKICNSFGSENSVIKI